MAASVLFGAVHGLFGTCGPFTDVSDASFCPFVLQIFYLGITSGTTPTTYDPAANVSRLQMAAFLSRTVDGTLRRANRRLVMDQFWTPQTLDALAVTTVGASPYLVKFDGLDVWSANTSDNTISRVRASDGKLLETWTGAIGASGLLPAIGRVFASTYGNFYRIDPSQPAGAVTIVTSNLGSGAESIAFDGTRFFTANFAGASVSIVTPSSGLPWLVSTVTTGYVQPIAVIFDGSRMWVTDGNAGKLHQINGSGGILQTVTVGLAPRYPAFDGANLWVPNNGSDSVSLVRASSGAVLQTLTGNGLNSPFCAATDGQRVLVTNLSGASVSLFRASDLAPLGVFAVGGTSYCACSDGANFWVSVGPNKLVRF